MDVFVEDETRKRVIEAKVQRQLLKHDRNFQGN